MSNSNTIYGEFFSALQRVLPHHTLSRLISQLAEAKTPWLKSLLIKQFIKAYKINLDEPVSSDPASYSTFNDFFTRPLKPESRIIPKNPETITSPADGFISQMGQIHDNQLIQAKGIYYSTDKLLGEDASKLGNFNKGEFATIYLSPSDYHRVHAPIDGQLIFSRYIPGKLFSVNSVTTENIANLFTRNERLVSIFDTSIGKCALVMVGAMLVAGISSIWHGRYKPGFFLEKDHQKDGISLNKGAELGQFYFGSTVILMFEQQKSNLLDTKLAFGKVTMGTAIGHIDNPKEC